MTTFHYEGISASGAKVEGVVEAVDKQDAATKARESCRQVTKIEKVNTSKAHNILHMDMGAFFSGGKIKPKALSLLCSQLAIELKAGLPLVSSLKLVSENEKDDTIRKMLSDVGDDVMAGQGLADSFAKRGPGLPKSFIETVRAGEESGKLDECFDRLKAYYEDSAEISSKVKGAMIYPIMLISVAVIVVIIIMCVAVPVFEDTFKSLGGELPMVTKMLISLSNFMTDYWMIILSTAAVIGLGLALFKRTEKGKHVFAYLALTFPGVKMITKMKAAAQYAATMGTMLSSGLPIVQAVQITAATLDNLLISEDVAVSAEGILEGKRLSDGLRKSSWLPNLLVEMSAVGEETGKLEETLGVVSDYYNKEVGTAVKRALEILNPIITLCLAVMVVFVLLSVYMPIFSMYDTI